MKDGHGHPAGGHSHTALDHDLLTHARAVRALWVSVIALAVTAGFQLVIVGRSGSTGLFADALHNIVDVAGTAMLWVAFQLSRRAATDRFPYGWRRAEDLAGILIIVAIFGSALLAGWESFDALLGGGHEVRNIGWAFGAAVVGIIGNEAVAQYKIRVGRDIDSVALIADGQHARVDGLVSAAAAIGIVAAWLGFPQADPIAGLAITAAILWILFEVGRDVLSRAMDGVDPQLLPRLEAAARGVPGVEGVHDLRARHLGRSVLVQMHVDVPGDLTLRQAHAVGEEVRHRIAHELPSVGAIDVHIDPAGEEGDAHARTQHHFGHGAHPHD